MIDYTDISYLRSGNPRQRAVWETLTRHRVMERLAPYDPLLAGTIPIGIDILSSDLDILCRYDSPEAFSLEVEEMFGRERDFSLGRMDNAVVVSFSLDDFVLEIYGSATPTPMQAGFRHMLIEDAVLREKGGEFRREIVALKLSGIKTEPAFARLLGLDGDPYGALLAYGHARYGL